VNCRHSNDRQSLASTKRFRWSTFSVATRAGIWGGDGKSCPKGRCQGQLCSPESITEPLALGEAILFNSFFQSRPYSLVVTRLIIQPLVEKLNCRRVLGSLRHPSGFHSLRCPDVLLFVSQETYLLGGISLVRQPTPAPACCLARTAIRWWTDNGLSLHHVCIEIALKRL